MIAPFPGRLVPGSITSVRVINAVSSISGKVSSRIVNAIVATL